MDWGQAGAIPDVYEDVLVPAFFATYADELLARARPQRGERMLDVATGTGVVLRRARAQDPALARLTGVDLSPAMLDTAARHIDAEFVVGDATALPFDDSEFDVVTCQQGLQFFPDRQRAAGEMRRVLGAEGRAAVACWCELATQPAFAALIDALAGRFPQLAAVAGAPFSLSDADELRELFSGAGFGHIEVDRVDAPGRFTSAEALVRGFLRGTPLALAVDALPPAERGELADQAIATVRARFDEPIEAPMAAHIVTARA